MSKYIGITIGPIIKTLMMARKPRELFSASFLFSYLTKCILEELRKEKGIILSPAYYEEPQDPHKEPQRIGIGLYPDRIFYQYGKKDGMDFKTLLKQAFGVFRKEMFENSETEIAGLDTFIQKYFKVSAVEVFAQKDKYAIQALNRLLDGIELSNSVVAQEGKNPVLQLIIKRKNSPLFYQAFNNKDVEVPTLAEIATSKFRMGTEKWQSVKSLVADFEYGKKQLREIQEIMKKLEIPFEEEDKVFLAEDVFYACLKDAWGDQVKTFHKYICVVQADGDNMGKIVNDLEDNSLIKFSEDLIKFDIEAKDCIKGYGGLPIYAGGDDLLFIAPVEGKEGKHIFDLLNDIDLKFQSKMYDGNGECKYSSIYKPSMSYGVSINYYKYPLYEALEKARYLLFDRAKSIPGKNAVVWTLQKNSGSQITGGFCKAREVEKTGDIFRELINLTGDEDDNKNLISAVAHKIRANQALLKLFITSEKYSERLSSFFSSFLDAENKTQQEKVYLDQVLKLMNETIAPYSKLFSTSGWQKIKEKLKEMKVITRDDITEKKALEAVVEVITEKVYCILRTVKFIKGWEEDHD